MKQEEKRPQERESSGLDAFPVRYDPDAGRSVRFGVKGGAPKKFIKLTILGQGLGPGDLALSWH
jgi:hypothetical protein